MSVSKAQECARERTYAASMRITPETSSTKRHGKTSLTIGRSWRKRLSGPKCNPWAVVLWPALKSFSGHGPRGNRLAPPSQRPPQVTEMFEYRAYLIGRDGKVIHRVDMLCDDDEAAKARAQLLIDIHIVELGQGTRDSPHHALWSGFLNVASQRNWPQLRGWSSWGHSLR